MEVGCKVKKRGNSQWMFYIIICNEDRVAPGQRHTLKTPYSGWKKQCYRQVIYLGRKQRMDYGLTKEQLTPKDQIETEIMLK